MASAPKAAPKAGKAAPEAADAPAPKKSKMKLIIIIAVAVVIVAGAAGGAMMFLRSSSPPAAGGEEKEKKKESKSEPAKAPVFVTLEPFVVNLQSEGSSTDSYLQVALTLQVPNAEQEEKIKNFMPLVRSRLLLLLSSKKGAELTNAEGKKKLQDDIIATVNQPFSEKGDPQEVSAVLFTSFVIQ